MPKTFIIVEVDSTSTYTPEQCQALQKVITEKVDLLTGVGAAALHFSFISPHFTDAMRYAQAVIARHLPGQYPDFMRHMEIASIAAQRDFHRMNQNWESEMQSAVRKAAREPWRRG